jgi:WD40 repeat protein
MGCAIAPDGSYIVSASKDDTLRIWNPQTGETTHTLTGHAERVWGCAIAPDGSYILSASKDNTLRIWR